MIRIWMTGRRARAIIKVKSEECEEEVDEERHESSRGMDADFPRIECYDGRNLATCCWPARGGKRSPRRCPLLQWGPVVIVELR